MKRALLFAAFFIAMVQPAHAQYRTCDDFTLGPNQQIEACTAFITHYNSAGSALLGFTPDERHPPNLFLNRGAAYARKGDSRTAQGDYEHAIKLDTEEIDRGGRFLPIHLSNRCWARAVANIELDLALADCNDALKALPRFPQALGNRALVYLRMNRTEDAIKDYDVSLRMMPKSPYSLYGRGIAKLRLGDVEGAKDDLFRAEGLRPGTRVQYAAIGFTD